MTIEDIKSRLPDYAKDLKLNLSSLLREESLTEQQLWGCFLASAIAARNQEILAAIDAEARDHLAPEARAAARAAAAVMSMNNVYYRFVHLASVKDYQGLPARLRMNVIANPGVEKSDFELWSLVVSAINGCGLCIDAHEAELRKAGLSQQTIQAAIRIAATIHALAVVLDSEASAELPRQAAA